MPANLENSTVAIGLEKVSFLSFQSQGKAMPKNAQTTVKLKLKVKLKVIFKILQDRLQQYMNCEFQKFKLDLEKTEEPGIKLTTSLGSEKKQRNSRKTSISASLQRRQWQPTPVLLPGKSHGQRSLVGCRPWGRKESDTTERPYFHFHFTSE